MLLLHLPMGQHQLLLTLLILILLLLPTHLLLLPHIHHIPIQILTIQMDHTHRWHPQPHTHHLLHLTHHIPHIHLPIHSPHTLHHLPIHPPHILLPPPIRLLQLIHHLRIHRLQVILLEYTLHRLTDRDLLPYIRNQGSNITWLVYHFITLSQLYLFSETLFLFCFLYFSLSSFYSIRLFSHEFIISIILAKVCHL